MNHKCILLLLVALTSATIVSRPTRAATTILRPGPEASKDAHISDGGNANTNFGDDFYAVIGWGNGLRSIGLLQFDLSSIPQNAAISSAALSLYQGANNNQGQRYDVFRITSPWEEAMVTFNAKPMFAPAPVSSLIIPNSVPQTFRTWNVTDVVADWVNGTFVNHGMWIEKSPVSSSANAYFLASDATVVVGDSAEFWPSLTVTWIPEPGSHSIAMSWALGLSLFRQRQPPVRRRAEVRHERA